MKRVLISIAAGMAGWGALHAVAADHPFILWTREEAAAIQKHVLATPWARERFVERFRVQTNAWQRSAADNLFFYTMVGDRDAYRAEVEALMGFINAPPLVKDMTDWRWHHVDHSDMAIRYDIFYEEMTPAQRGAVYETFHQLAVFGIEEEPLRGFETVRMISHMFSALATRDKRLIEAIFECDGGGKEYFDGIMEGHFTPRGQNPSHRTIGQIWMWCRAVERLGMNELGFGYRNARGESLRDLLEGIALLGDPLIEIPGGTPYYGRSAIGLVFHGGSFHSLPMDRLPTEIFRAPIVISRLRDGGGGWPYWLSTTDSKAFDVYEHGTFRMYLSLVLELAHQRWPDSHFGYFLSRMRPRGAEEYRSSIYFGVKAIDPRACQPPAVRSAVYRSVDVALLRAEEGREFWASPAPYAVLRLPGRTPHREGSASLALSSLIAFNRPIYYHHSGAGSHCARWHRTAKPLSTVVVDNGIGGEPDPGLIRSMFDPLVKMAGVRSVPRTWTAEEQGEDGKRKKVARHAALYPGVEAERVLALTREYLFDVFRLKSDRERTYDWMVQALGSAEPDEPARWKPTTALNETLPGQGSRGLPFNYMEQHAFDPRAETWSLNAVQTSLRTNLAETVLGPEWYGRRVGVRVSMLGEPGTRAFYARRPLARRLTREESEWLETQKHPLRLHPRSREYDQVDRQVTELQILPPNAKPLKPGDRVAIKRDRKPMKIVGEVVGEWPEYGGVTIIGERKAAETAFVALHEPFERGAWRIHEFRRIQQTPEAVAVAVRGRGESPVNDRILLALGDAAEQPLTLQGDGERFRFKGFAYLRIAPGKVTACGDLLAFKLKVAGRPALVLNGEARDAAVKDGLLTYGE